MNNDKSKQTKTDNGGSIEQVDKQDEILGSEQRNAKRSLLKKTLIGGGAVMSTGLTSEQWVKPLVNAVILPGHAQTSGAPVVMGGGSGVMVSKADSTGLELDDMLNIFVPEAHAATGELTGSCVMLTVDGSTATVQMTLNTNAVDTQVGTVSGTSVNVTGLHSGYTVAGTLDSASNPTTCSGSVSGFSESGSFSISSATPVCGPIVSPPPSTVAPTTTASPTTTTPPTTTPVPNANPNVAFSFSLSKSYWT